MHQALSPLIQSAIKRTTDDWLTRLEGKEDKPRRSLDPVYICPECGDHHLWENDALDCCEEDDAHTGSAGLHKSCPVCDTKHNDAHEAADCCLWRDTTPHQRYLMAFRLEADPRITWQEAIAYAMDQPQPF